MNKDNKYTYNNSSFEVIRELRSKGILSLSKDGEFIISDDIQRVTHQNNPIKMSWDNSDDMMYVDKLIRNGDNIKITPYLDNTVMYMFITSLTSKEDNNRYIICKISKTDDIIRKLNSLRKKYECEFYLCKLKLIKNRSIEVKFYEEVKAMYKELVIDSIVNGKSRNRLYILSPKLVQHFDNVIEYDRNKTLRELNEDEQDVQKYIENQHLTIEHYRYVDMNYDDMLKMYPEKADLIQNIKSYQTKFFTEQEKRSREIAKKDIELTKEATKQVNIKLKQEHMAKTAEHKLEKQKIISERKKKKKNDSESDDD